MIQSKLKQIWLSLRGDRPVHDRRRRHIIDYYKRPFIIRSLARINCDVYSDELGLAAAIWFDRARRVEARGLVFKRLMADVPNPVVLELGSRSLDQGVAKWKVFVPHAAAYFGLDIVPAPGVDVVVDAHEMSRAFRPGSFDAIISVATLEHLQRPWVVAPEISRTLKTGGLIFIIAPQTYPVHVAPYDYWRFSVDGLKIIFNTDAGFEVVEAGYEYPCRILAWNNPELGRQAKNSHLIAYLVARKVADPAEDRRDNG